MDLLKGITEELGRSDRDTSSDRDADRSESTRDSTDRARDEEHVCDFCGTAFPAGDRACPDCGAELIVRGAR